MQDQLVCRGCRNTLMYPRGAMEVCCALCNTISMVPHPPRPPPPHPHGMDMAHIICGGCRTMLMYPRGASRVICSSCQTTNLVPDNQVAHISCGHCRTTLMYPYGASSVKCAICQFVTPVNMMGNGRVPLPTNRPNGTASPVAMPSTSTQSTASSQTQTVVVENPMSVDESGKLVSNVVVGVTTDKK